MKKIYIIRIDNRIDTILSNKKTALEQIDIILGMIEKGTWFISRPDNKEIFCNIVDKTDIRKKYNSHIIKNYLIEILFGNNPNEEFSIISLEEYEINQGLRII